MIFLSWSLFFKKPSGEKRGALGAREEALIRLKMTREKRELGF
jgi:hypothetical protein